MSAFVCNPYHIASIVNYALAQQPTLSYCWEHGEPQNYWRNAHIDHTTAAHVGQALTNENYRSVNYRYDKSDAAPKYKHNLNTQPLSAVQCIKACDCLAYQSCETPDWEQTEAHAILEAIREAAIGNLPGYEAAAWEINPPANKIVWVVYTDNQKGESK